MNAKQLFQLGDDQFKKRQNLLLFWQEVADNFYPERADFTWQRTLGTDFAAGSMTSYPFLCRRDFGDQIGAMMRPAGKSWFHMFPVDVSMDESDVKAFLEWTEGVQRRAMYDRVTLFARAMKEGDHDFATFGQCVISIEMNYGSMALLYRTHHLRDVVWIEGEDGQICAVWRRWKPQARELAKLYPFSVHQNIKNKLEKEPFAECNCVHMVVESDMYTGDCVGPHAPKRGAQPRFLVCYDIDNDTVLEALPIWGKHYIVPRWETVSGSQYAFSPAVTAALPDARLIQAMTLTLLEAGEKITNPPMIATQEVVRSDVNIFPGGITWVDMEYDEKLGAALRPLTTDSKGMPIGIDMQRDSRSLIHQAFYLNKLKPFLPTEDKEMTAFQSGQIVAQYIREAMPLFEPMEPEYNGQVCEETFELLMRNGAFGNPRDFPRQLRGAEIQFRFESPLHDAIESIKGQKFLEMKQLLAEAMALDSGAAYLPDVRKALRDALLGVGVPARWIHTEADVEALQKQAAEKQMAEAQLQRMVVASEATKNIASANKDNAAATAPA